MFAVLAAAAVVALLALALPRLYTLFFRPIQYYNPIDPWMHSTSTRGRPTHKLSVSPSPSYPNSWFRVLDSCDLPTSSSASYVHNVLRVRLGRLVLLFRPPVEEDADELQAPPTPRCLVLPHSASLDSSVHFTAHCTPVVDGVTYEQATATFWQVHEANGEIYVWHHADGEAPGWLPLSPPELSHSSPWRWHGRSYHPVSCHVAEIPENGADVAHLNVLHDDFIVPMLQPVLSHRWHAEWKPGRDERAHLHVKQAMVLLHKLTLPGSEIDVQVIQQGLGLVFLEFQTLFGRLYVIETVTPVQPALTIYHHTVWAQPSVPRVVAKGVLRGLIVQAERDIPVWNYKRYINPPMVVLGDGPIAQFRRFAKQFYSPSSAALDALPPVADPCRYDTCQYDTC